MAVKIRSIQHRARKTKPPRSAGTISSYGLPLGLPVAQIKVDETTAVKFSAVYRAITLIAQSVASLPIRVYQRTSRGREPLTEHPISVLLHETPNEEQTPFAFFEFLTGMMAQWGNAYAEIVLRGDMPVALWPLHSSKVTVRRDEELRLMYEYRADGRPPVFLTPRQVLHVRLYGDGVTGWSVIRQARESIGLGLAAEAFGARFFGGGATPSVILEHPGKIGELAAANLRKSWWELHGGPERQLGVAVLEEGMKANKVGIPPEDAQFLETRQHQIAEIARWFGIPPHLLGDLSRATFSNIEHQAIEFLKYTLMPWLVRWEQEINSKLLGRPSERSLFVKFTVDALQRGDIQSRYNAYAIGRQWGWLSANDIRRMEDMNPLPGSEGDLYITPLNMIPAGSVSPESAPEPQSEPAPQADDIEPVTEDERSTGNNEPDPLRDALRDLLADVVGRLVKQEITGLARAFSVTSDIEGAVRRFYRRLEPRAIEMLRVPVRSCNRAGLSDVTSSRAASWYVDEGRKAALACADNGRHAQKLMDDMATTRATLFVNRLLARA